MGKRIFDFSLSIIFLLVFSPLILFISAITATTSGFPIFFRQTRVGLAGRPFKVLKFRTMEVGSGFTGEVPEAASEEEINRLRAQFRTAGRNDPRVTPVGAVLRKSYLDELPQLFNVLRGDMSFVGPRPDTPVQKADVQPAYWKERHKVRPGITGLAQVNNHRVRSLSQRLAYDILYVRKATFLLDLYILALTVIRVLQSRSF